MAQSVSHSHVISSSSSADPLPTLSAKAREHAARLRTLADDLDRHDSDDLDGDAGIGRAIDLLLNDDD